MNPKAQVAQDLCRPGLPDTHVDRSLVEARLRRGKPRHRGQERDFGRAGFIRNRHSLRTVSRGHPKWPAVERLLVRIVELETAGPASIPRHAVDGDLDANIRGALTAIHPAHLADMKLAPQEVGIRYGNGDEIAAVDGNARALRGRLPTGAAFVPALEPDVPEGERLKGGGLAGVVRTDEDDGASQLDLDLSESFEVADGEPGEHPTWPATANGSTREGPASPWARRDRGPSS